MTEITLYLRYASDKLEICLTYAIYIIEISLINAWYMDVLCLRYTWEILEIYLPCAFLYAWYIPKKRLRYAKIWIWINLAQLNLGGIDARIPESCEWNPCLACLSVPVIVDPSGRTDRTGSSLRNDDVVSGTQSSPRTSVCSIICTSSHGIPTSSSQVIGDHTVLYAAVSFLLSDTVFIVLACYLSPSSKVITL